VIQNLVTVASVGPVAPLASVIVPHGLKSDGKPIAPNQVICDRASSLAVTAANDVTVTFMNTSSSSPASATFRIEHDHSIHAVDAPLVSWQGYLAPSSLPPSGPAGGDLDQTYPNPRVVGFASQPIDVTAPAASDYWQFDGAVWRHTPVSPGTPAAVYGSFSDNADQPLVAGTPATVRFGTTEGANGVSVQNNGLGVPTRLTVAAAGVYEFALSPQLLHTGGGTVTITFWARTNTGVVPRSASSLEMGNNNNRSLPFIGLILTMGAGDWLEWVFLSTGSNTSLEHFPAVVGPPAIPDIPSVIGSVKLIGI
jgi:hypothetical protein